MKKRSWVITFSMLVVFSAIAFANDLYKVELEHKGGDVTPQQAYEMLKANPGHIFLVDVRTQFEYQDIGHPEGAINIPYKFYTTKVDEKGYKKTKNENFANDLRARFNPETDTLLLICRSGKRSCEASTAAVDAGFNPEKVFNVMGGVEGDKVKDKDSPLHGQRMVNGWKNEKLPWTYSMDHKLMYQADL